MSTPREEELAAQVTVLLERNGELRKTIREVLVLVRHAENCKECVIDFDGCMEHEWARALLKAGQQTLS